MQQNWTLITQEVRLTTQELNQKLTKTDMGNTTFAIQFQSFFDELTEDEKEEEI